mgnify:CR=1 FL=1
MKRSALTGNDGSRFTETFWENVTLITAILLGVGGLIAAFWQ